MSSRKQRKWWTELYLDPLNLRKDRRHFFLRRARLLHHQGWQWTPWMAGGGLDKRQRANERARKLLAEHHPKPLTDDQEREIDRIAAEAQKKAMDQGPYSMSGA